MASGNAGSCRNLAYYLDKENQKLEIKEQHFFFSQTQNKVHTEEVIKQIDQNGKGGIRKGEARFYSIVFSPSQKELEYIGNSAEKLMNYTRKAMELYAHNFNKGLEGKDIVWYAKIEYQRIYKMNDKIPSDKKKGDEKDGLQTHIHVIVSRKTADKKRLISPLANERGKTYKIGDKQMIKGFDRNIYKEKCEKLFDELFSYPRKMEETFHYMKNKSKASTIEEKIHWIWKAKNQEKDQNKPQSISQNDVSQKLANQLNEIALRKKRMLAYIKEHCKRLEEIRMQKKYKARKANTKDINKS